MHTATHAHRTRARAGSTHHAMYEASASSVDTTAIHHWYADPARPLRRA
jgi:hypothetical protein